MADEAGASRAFDGSMFAGVTHLFRAFKIARDPRKLLLAAAAIVILYAVGRILDGMWSKDSRVVISETGTTEIQRFIDSGFSRAQTRDWVKLEGGRRVEHDRIGVFRALLRHARTVVHDLSAAALHVDVARVIRAIVATFGAVVWLVFMHPGYALIFIPLWLVVWAYFGGAVCRMAAIEVTRDERMTYRDALGFSRRKFVSFLAAPLLPLALAVGIGLLLAVGGLLGAIPGFGTIVAPLFWFLALVGGFIMALAVVGLAVGWPLMYPTIAVEGSDAFDAVSRSYAYIGERIWRTLFYGAIALVYGAICLVFVKLFVRIMLFLVAFWVGLSMNIGDASGRDGKPIADKLTAMWKAPALDFSNTFYGDFGYQSLSGASSVGAFFIAFWTFLVVAIVAAFVVSYLFSASTLIYVLLRRDVDATDYEEVYTDEEEEVVSSAPSPGATAGADAASTPAGGTRSLGSLPVVGQDPQPPPAAT
ncbi:MAG: hypothetical protein L6Q92_05440 [Phycisphaerae bacterium]|nr:hypothetical protein [Phycisphaerae bacterium]